ncbi:hypothetical protein [Serratia sp. P2ACOL2]|uniref:hypothetical protein n=1 Tax=Serratia sp. P2ACOL2 TaxID=2482769 RepID=UPI000EFB5186|nr:hypothetical protein [Serratia sp. P2ACOL2]AYO38511.1 hypothetical protein EBA31_14935 [Serratia sp. P2ACOL2]
MDNKLSELSKPVATVDVQRGRQDGNMFAVAWSSAGHALPDGPHFIYSQEYVSALLAELDGMEQSLNVANDATRIWKERALDAESCGRLEYTRRVERENAELKAKLATPVRLPPLMDGELFGKNSGTANAHNNAITACSIAIRGAGFKSEVTAPKCVGDE